jgi:hypothetical protein
MNLKYNVIIINLKFKLIKISTYAYKFLYKKLNNVIYKLIYLLNQIPIILSINNTA